MPVHLEQIRKAYVLRPVRTRGQVVKRIWSCMLIARVPTYVEDERYKRRKQDMDNGFLV